MGILERKEREREARRTAILDAAEVVFRLKGFANATMDDIAREAELAKGTVYLYYKSKEELQVGLVMRGLDRMLDFFQDAASTKSTAFEKLLTLGDAYWNFAMQQPFYFQLMNSTEQTQNLAQVGQETLLALHAQSNMVWTAMIESFEKSKLEGMIKPDVDAFTVSVLMWMNATSILRFYFKIQSTPDSVWSGKQGFNPCNLDFHPIYNLNGGILFHQVVTEAGRALLPPIIWPEITSQLAVPDARSLGGLQLPTFEDEMITPQIYQASRL